MCFNKFHEFCHAYVISSHSHTCEIFNQLSVYQSIKFKKKRVLADISIELSLYMVLVGYHDIENICLLLTRLG